MYLLCYKLPGYEVLDGIYYAIDKKIDTVSGSIFDSKIYVTPYNFSDLTISNIYDLELSYRFQGDPYKAVGLNETETVTGKAYNAFQDKYDDYQSAKASMVGEMVLAVGSSLFKPANIVYGYYQINEGNEASGSYKVANGLNGALQMNKWYKSNLGSGTNFIVNCIGAVTSCISIYEKVETKKDEYEDAMGHILDSFNDTSMWFNSTYSGSSVCASVGDFDYDNALKKKQFAALGISSMTSLEQDEIDSCTNAILSLPNTKSDDSETLDLVGVGNQDDNPIVKAERTRRVFLTMWMGYDNAKPYLPVNEEGEAINPLEGLTQADIQNYQEALSNYLDDLPEIQEHYKNDFTIQDTYVRYSYEWEENK